MCVLKGNAARRGGSEACAREHQSQNCRALKQQCAAMQRRRPQLPACREAQGQRPRTLRQPSVRQSGLGLGDFKKTSWPIASTPGPSRRSVRADHLCRPSTTFAPPGFITRRAGDAVRFLFPLLVGPASLLDKPVLVCSVFVRLCPQLRASGHGSAMHPFQSLPELLTHA